MLLYLLVNYLRSILFFILFALFKLAGWPKRAIIARGSQWVPKDIVAISLSLSLAIVGTPTAENEPLKVLAEMGGPL